MKIYRLTTVFALALASIASAALPQPIGYVSDYIGLLDRQQVERITQAAKAIEASTGAEIAVIVQDTLGEYYSVEELALAYLTEWKVGQEVKITILRGTDKEEIEVTPSEAPYVARG